MVVAYSAIVNGRSANGETRQATTKRAGLLPPFSHHPTLQTECGHTPARPILPVVTNAKTEGERRLIRRGGRSAAVGRVPEIRVQRAERGLIPVVVVERYLPVEQVEHVGKHREPLADERGPVVDVHVDLRIHR